MLWHYAELHIFSNLSEYDLVEEVFKVDLVGLFVTWVRPKAEHIAK